MKKLIAAAGQRRKPATGVNERERVRETAEAIQSAIVCGTLNSPPRNDACGVQGTAQIVKKRRILGDYDGIY